MADRSAWRVVEAEPGGGAPRPLAMPTSSAACRAGGLVPGLRPGRLLSGYPLNIPASRNRAAQSKILIRAA